MISHIRAFRQIARVSKKVHMQGIRNPEEWAPIGVCPDHEGGGYSREMRDKGLLLINFILNRIQFLNCSLLDFQVKLFCNGSVWRTKIEPMASYLQGNGNSL